MELIDTHPIINAILEFRATKKLLSTYIDPLPALINPDTGKIHTTFNQALTSTGRLSSVRPNLQNIPIRTEKGREIRKAFIPCSPDGFIVSADYSQIELRLMAELSQDEGLLEDFRNGQDIHASTASKIFKISPLEVTREQRRQAKVANFGIIYGISAFGLSQRLNIPRGESKALINEYFKSYPKVKEYMDNAIKRGKEQGYVETLFGRKRYLPDINSKNQVVRGLSERNAINAPIQGSAADIIKMAMINVHNRIKKEKLKSVMVLQVHDELVFDVISSELDIMLKLVKEEMENVYKLSIPLIVDCSYGKNWLEAH
jgi:DNA polymerase-1